MTMSRSRSLFLAVPCYIALGTAAAVAQFQAPGAEPRKPWTPPPSHVEEVRIGNGAVAHEHDTALAIIAVNRHPEGEAPQERPMLIAIGTRGDNSGGMPQRFSDTLIGMKAGGERHMVMQLTPDNPTIYDIKLVDVASTVAELRARHPDFSASSSPPIGAVFQSLLPESITVPMPTISSPVDAVRLNPLSERGRFLPQDPPPGDAQEQEGASVPTPQISVPLSAIMPSSPQQETPASQQPPPSISRDNMMQAIQQIQAGQNRQENQPR